MSELTTEQVKRLVAWAAVVRPSTEANADIDALFSEWFGQVRREAKAEELREAAAEWTQGDWAGATRYHNRAADRLASAQYAGDWLRARADQMEEGK